MKTLTSPLLRYAPYCAASCAVTEAELETIIDLALARGAQRITVGSGRTPSAAAAASAITTTWERAGRVVESVLTWPETAASWLRQAERFCRNEPDLWIMTGPALGWSQMTRRLLWSTGWDPARTLATADIGTTDSLQLVGLHHLDGLTGAAGDGTNWTVVGERLHRTAGMAGLPRGHEDPPPPRPAAASTADASTSRCT
jgi:hypothetical protein